MAQLSVETLAKLIRDDHPYWAENGVQSEAQRLFAELDDRLKDFVCTYAETGRRTDFRHDAYSLSDICILRGCSYLEAIDLLNEFIKDPARGKALIQRRQGR